MVSHDYQKNSIRAKINHELWKGVRFDFSTSLQQTKVDGGGSLGGALKQTILQNRVLRISMRYLQHIRTL